MGSKKQLIQKISELEVTNTVMGKEIVQRKSQHGVEIEELKNGIMN